MSTVRFQRHGNHYAVRFAYHPGLVELLKSVPNYARTYDPSTKTWMVDDDYAEMLADDLRELGHTVLGLAQRAQQCHVDDAGDWARTLFRAVGPTRHGAIFRAVSRVVHPDASTGDAALMRELLAARAELDDRKESA